MENIYADTLLEAEPRARKLSARRQYYHSALVDDLPCHLCPKANKCGKKSKTRVYIFLPRLDVRCYDVFEMHA